MTRNHDLDESEPATAAPTAALHHTDVVAEAHERMPTTSSAHGRHIDAGPGPRIAREMARRWLAQANINAAAQPGMTSAEQAEIKQLRAEVERLREDNEVLKAATVLFAGELDPRNH